MNQDNKFNLGTFDKITKASEEIHKQEQKTQKEAKTTLNTSGRFEYVNAAKFWPIY